MSINPDSQASALGTSTEAIKLVLLDHEGAWPNNIVAAKARQELTALESALAKANGEIMALNAALSDDTVRQQIIRELEAELAIATTRVKASERVDLPASFETPLTEWSLGAPFDSGDRAADAVLSVWCGKYHIGNLTLGWFREHTSLCDGEKALRPEVQRRLSARHPTAPEG